MKQTIQLTIEVDVSGHLLSDPETGPDEVVNVRVDEVRLPGRALTSTQAAAHLGAVIDCVLDEIDPTAWEDE